MSGVGRALAADVGRLALALLCEAGDALLGAERLRLEALKKVCGRS